jgi:methyl-accepting chemotaxis protein
MEALIGFLGIDSRSRGIARRIWPLVEHRAADLIDDFYTGISPHTVEPRRTREIVEHLKASQRGHWKNLFESRFDENYFRTASLIGIRHCEMGLDAKWHVAGYARMKSELSTELLQAPLSGDSAPQVIATLDKYLALDLAISLSSYTCVLLD